MFDDYSRIVSEAKYNTKYGEGLKTLSSKQMLQRSESLLNQIRQIIYSLYREKEVTKNVYNNIMKSIKL